MLYRSGFRLLGGNHVHALFLRFLPLRPFRVNRQQWERQYAHGEWDCLRRIDELAHYSAIAGYCRYLKDSGSILDIGCGEGILRNALRGFEYSRYVGVDIAAEAIRRASRIQDDRACFVRANAERYDPGRRFDIIVFNECLYYFDDPAGVLRRYEGSLAKGGIVIVSMHATERSRRIWKAIENDHRAEDEVQVTHRSGVSWTIKVFVPARSGEVEGKAQSPIQEIAVPGSR